MGSDAPDRHLGALGVESGAHENVQYHYHTLSSPQNAAPLTSLKVELGIGGPLRSQMAE